MAYHAAYAFCDIFYIFLAKCKWTELRAMQKNNEFTQCKDEANFGEARFKCKIPKEQRSGKKGARCSCKNSRKNRNDYQIKP